MATGVWRRSPQGFIDSPIGLRVFGLKRNEQVLAVLGVNHAERLVGLVVLFRQPDVDVTRHDVFGFEVAMPTDVLSADAKHGGLQRFDGYPESSFAAVDHELGVF